MGSNKSDGSEQVIDWRKIMGDTGNLTIIYEKKLTQIHKTESCVNEEDENVIPKVKNIYISCSFFLPCIKHNMYFNFQNIKIPVLNISKTQLKIVARTEYAEMMDTTVPVVNFEKKIPDLAVKYDFELDTFQKLVIVTSYILFSYKYSSTVC